jgi:hypothetical protein
VMRTPYPTHCSVSDDTGHTGSNLHERHCYGLFVRDASDMFFFVSMGRDIITSLLPLY